MTNVMGTCYRAPFVAGWLTNRFLLLNQSDFTSDYGVATGPAAPHEAGRFWRRWFLGPSGTSLHGGVDGQPTQRMRGEVAAITRLFDAPVMFKNTYNSGRIAELAAVFPEAVFIEVRRDPVAVARSLLHARIHRCGHSHARFGFDPTHAKSACTKPYWEQIIDQILGINRSIDIDRRTIGNHRFVVIDYSDLCRSPPTELKRIQQFLFEKGTSVDTHNAPPVQLSKSPGKPIPAEDLKKIQEYCHNQLRHFESLQDKCA